MREEFLSTLDLIEAAFGEHAFKRWIPEKKQWRGQVLASLYDAEMLGIREFDLAQLKGKREEIVDGLKALFEDETFRKSIDAATNTVLNFRPRVEGVRNMLHAIIRG